jgi:TRAP-type C4-dicarboxylate transport system permease small subunit
MSNENNISSPKTGTASVILNNLGNLAAGIILVITGFIFLIGLIINITNIQLEDKIPEEKRDECQKKIINVKKETYTSQAIPSGIFGIISVLMAIIMFVIALINYLKKNKDKIAGIAEKGLLESVN